MSATITRGYSFGSTEQVTNSKLHTLVDSATISGITNDNIDAAAAIVYSKLSIGAAAINYDRLNLTGSIVNADVSASAAIAYSKLNLGTSIVNADISASAAIVDTKLAQITTAGKVSGASLTSLSSIPSGAGNIPIANLGNATTPYASGTILETYSMQMVASTSSATPQKLKELTPMVRSGIVSVSFDYASSSNASTNARIYVNGSAVGTNRSDNTGTFATFTQDITVVAGDLLQIYGNGDGSSTTAKVCNMKVLVTVPTIPTDNTNKIGKTYLGAGVPDGQVGDRCDQYVRTDGAASTTLYIKTDTSTWTAK